MKITHFEEIQAWQEARKVAKEIYNFTKRLGFRKDFNLTSQIQRAVISVMANIAEGFDRQSKKEFVQFLSFASASTSEVQSHLYVASDQGYITEEEFKVAYAQAQKVKSMINGFMAYLKGKR